MTYTIKDKVAIITGASSGFGRALAKRLVGMGGKVVLGDIDESAGASLVQELGGANAVFSKCNVLERADQEQLFKVATSKFGTVDIMVNNAGIADYSNYYEDDGVDSWLKVLHIDLDAVVLGTRLAFDYFANKASKPGVIINTASLAGIYPQGGQPVYAAAKSGVVALTRSVAAMAGPADVGVVAICPTFCPTGMIDAGVKALGEAFNDMTADRVPVELVVDAFLYAIENNERLNGHSVRVTAQHGIDVYTFGQGKPFKL